MKRPASIGNVFDIFVFKKESVVFMTDESGARSYLK